jgi:hypothetical protein
LAFFIRVSSFGTPLTMQNVCLERSKGLIKE